MTPHSVFFHIRTLRTAKATQLFQAIDLNTSNRLERLAMFVYNIVGIFSTSNFKKSIVASNTCQIKLSTK